MTIEDYDARLIAYLLGDLSEAEQREVEEQLAGSEEIRRQLEVLSKTVNRLEQLETRRPSTRLHDRFYQMMRDAEGGPERKVTRRLTIYRASAAAIVLLLVGFFAGNFWMGSRADAQMATAEMEQAKKTMHVLLDESSTSKRLQAVNASYAIPSADQEILDILIKVLREDESTSVRLAALDALTQFIGTEDVSLALARSISFQDNQVVQIALINLLVELKEKEVIPQLEDLIEKGDIDQNVKDQAQLGLLKML